MDTKPGDLVGIDGHGKVRIDRTVPLTWVLGLVGLAAVWAFNQDAGQKQLVSQVAALTTELKEVRTLLVAQNVNSVELKVKVLELERRVEALETRK